MNPPRGWRHVRPVVVRDHFDVFVMVTPIELGIHAEIGEMDRLVEIREVVFVRPFFNLARVASGRPSLSDRPRL